MPGAVTARSYKPVRVKTLVLIVGIAILLTASVAVWMWTAAQLPLVDSATPLTDAQRADLAVRQAQLQLDAIRNIVAIGAGTGGIIALTLALRRQYVKERVDDEVQSHNERTAQASEYDAAERRITDLYVKAAEQLGSDKAPVRMAALYALERVGQDNPTHRQTIANLMCAYLRMPFTRPQDLDVPDPPDLQSRIVIQGVTDSSDRHRREALKSFELKKEAAQQELEVRLAAQGILQRHTWCAMFDDGKTGTGPEYWEEMDLNLAGATLIDFDLSSCEVGDLDLRGATLNGATDFSNSIIGMFTGSNAKFRSRPDFDSARIQRSADFSDASFREGVRFDKVQFGSIAFFGKTRFYNTATFNAAEENVILHNALATRTPSDGSHVWPPGYKFKAQSDDDMGIVNEGGDS